MSEGDPARALRIERAVNTLYSLSAEFQDQALVVLEALREEMLADLVPFEPIAPTSRVVSFAAGVRRSLQPPSYDDE